MSRTISDAQLEELAALTGQSLSQLVLFSQRLLAAAELVHSGFDLPPAELYRLEGIGQFLFNNISKAQEGITLCSLLNQCMGFTSDAPKLECEWDARRDRAQEFFIHSTMPTAPVYPS